MLIRQREIPSKLGNKKQFNFTRNCFFSVIKTICCFFIFFNRKLKLKSFLIRKDQDDLEIRFVIVETNRLKLQDYIICNVYMVRFATPFCCISLIIVVYFPLWRIVSIMLEPYISSENLFGVCLYVRGSFLRSLSNSFSLDHQSSNFIFVFFLLASFFHILRNYNNTEINFAWPNLDHSSFWYFFSSFYVY